MKTINDYNSIPPTEYRKFLDEITKQIAYANSLNCPDSDRLEILRGALKILIESEGEQDEDLE